MIVNYDLRFQPHSLGDVLDFAAISQTTCVEARFIFSYDLAQIACPDPAFRNITPQNFMDYVGRFYKAPLASPNITGVEVTPRLDMNGYERWPKQQDSYAIYWLHEMLRTHIKAGGKTPRLHSPEVFEHTPYVSINLRDNPNDPARNSNPRAWRELFEKHPEETFVCIGDVVNWGLPNVEYVNGGTLKDLAVIENSKFHMGTASGPCEMAKFGVKPYCVIEKTDRSISNLAGFEGDRWIFSLPGQKTIVAEEEFPVLEREYKRLCSLS